MLGGVFPVWCRQQADGSYLLTLHIQPGAKKTEIVGEHGDALKVRRAAPPVDGKANAALLAYLADKLAIPRHQLSLKSGETSRRKVVVVCAGDPLCLLAIAANG